MSHDTGVEKKTDRIMVVASDTGILVCSVLSGVLLCLAAVGWAHVSNSFLLALILVWCGFLWMRYLHEKRDTKWKAWVTFACAFLLSSTAILLALFLVTKWLGQ